MSITDEDLVNRFSYHKPSSDEVADLYEDIRSEAKRFASFLVNNTPTGREQSIAITNLEEVVFWANAAVARNNL